MSNEAGAVPPSAEGSSWRYEGTLFDNYDHDASATEAIEDSWKRKQERAMARLRPGEPSQRLDLGNASVVTPTMDLTNTLLLIACSSTKRACPAGTSTPLYELYDGSIWQTLRTHLVSWQAAHASVVVLSGKFGIVSAGMHARPYEARLTDAKADSLIRQGIIERQDHFGELRRAHSPGLLAQTPLSIMSRPGNDTDRPTDTGWQGVIICGGETYRRAFMALLQQLIDWGGVAKGAPVLVTRGGIGTQRSQLGRWVDDLVDHTPGLHARLAIADDGAELGSTSRATLQQNGAGAW